MARHAEVASKGSYILDIREEAEYLLEYIPGSVNIPFTRIKKTIRWNS